MSDVRVRFCGAAQEVTGSMHLVEANGHMIALDCGLFQGRRKESNEKNRQLCKDASRIDAVILSHAHVDHCGRLPMLVKQGFRGNVFATPPTCDLVKILLADSAHIQEEDAERVLDELWDGATLLNIPWEGITLQDDFFIAIYLANNEYGLSFVIPDEEWVEGKLREMIEYILDPLPSS